MRSPIRTIGFEGPPQTTGLIGHRCKASNGFSRVVLTWPFGLIIKISISHRSLTGGGSRCRVTLIKAHVRFQYRFSGGYSERVTPVPIPNTEVKPLRADGTAWVAVWESRSPPDYFNREPHFSNERWGFAALAVQIRI